MINVRSIVVEKRGHTCIQVKIPGRFFLAFACSCGAMSDDFPSLKDMTL